MSARVEAISSMEKRIRRLQTESILPDSFGGHVFHKGVMESVLPRKVFLNLLAAIEGREKIAPEHADPIAEAMKDWALKQGATHFSHWFQPLTHGLAEKQDAFLSWGEGSDGLPIESFKGSDLFRGEPDASSFPSGGLRQTHQARGYTSWDPSSYPFIWEASKTLCIPSVFFSWKGEALDHKIPLLRSEEKLNRAGLRLAKICGIPAGRVYSTLGAEQEYFAIDRSLYLLRPDLMLAGRTVFGARPPKGQELEDHYFSPVKERVLAFMRDFEAAAFNLGIPVKTRHQEVAPSQYEVAPLFEKAASAVDHNLLLMELMRQIACKHGLVCLLHEKPFAFVNGSGKHNNWSMATDTGINLLNPKEGSLSFLILLTAVLWAVHEHAGLLRASIGSAGNDHRLGGSEAPPTILSVYLGEVLERFVSEVIHDQKHFPSPRSIDLGLTHISQHAADVSDRNRTSFFAFTGNKFEFRAVGASANCSLPITVINSIVADSLQLILDEIADVLKDRKLGGDALYEAVLPVLRKFLKSAQPVLFDGNNYSAEWQEEALERGLPNIRKSFSAFSQFLEKKSLRVFEGVLSEKEVHSRYEIFVEQYAKTMNIEANLMSEIFRTQILPAALLDQKNRADSLALLKQLGMEPAHQLESLREFAATIDQAIRVVEEMEKIAGQTQDLGWEAKAKVFCELAAPKMEQARKSVDLLETRCDNALWPLPKYREMLFLS